VTKRARGSLRVKLEFCFDVGILGIFITATCSQNHFQRAVYNFFFIFCRRNFNPSWGKKRESLLESCGDISVSHRSRHFTLFETEFPYFSHMCVCTSASMRLVMSITTKCRSRKIFPLFNDRNCEEKGGENGLNFRRIRFANANACNVLSTEL